MSDAAGASGEGPHSVEELEALLSEPREQTIRALHECPGDILVLGAGGKMGPTLARMAREAATRADHGSTARRVIAVSRFHNADAERALQVNGVETISCDLLDRAAVAQLPDAPNVIFMAGQKFGTRDAPASTWAMNAIVPAICAERFPHARVVAFSTGNVYSLTSRDGEGSREGDMPAPIGEYAASCLARERVFEHYASANGTAVVIVRLNYAVDLRYGVLTDLATRILNAQPIDLTMGYVNCIWQGDANRVALELLPYASSPPLVVNVTGAKHSVRDLAIMVGTALGRAPEFSGSEAPDALLSDASRMRELLPAPEVDIDALARWTASWVSAGRPLLGKPTHFQARDGSF
ncbi:MAG: dependent epimerase/dehydratase family protein [Gemmatimonadetes bacterium]|nr:dependent epimerase/dehydratase family protein [Gemmatimonadota bacterium]